MIRKLKLRWMMGSGAALAAVLGFVAGGVGSAAAAVMVVAVVVSAVRTFW